MSKKILVIDDDKDIAQLLMTRLKANNYQVFVAYDGMQAKQIAHREMPDLIISDIMMPAGGGRSVFAALRSSATTSTIPFIFITGLTHEDVSQRGLEIPIEDFFKKPFDGKQIVERIKQILGE